MTTESQSRFDEESASRPYLEAQLERQRQEVKHLRSELKKAWGTADKLKAENVRLSVIRERIEDARFGRKLERALEAAEERRAYRREMGVL